MPLIIPNIDSLFSIWTKRLRVTGALPKATISIKSIGSSPRDIASGIARGGEDWVDLLPNISILADDRLVVQQKLVNESSDWTPDALAYVVSPVPDSPKDLRPVEIVSRLWECGEFIFLKGAVPGASLEFSYGPANTATAEAPDGIARLHLEGKLTKANPVNVKQVTPIGSSLSFNSTTAKVQVLPVSQPQPLPAPTLPQVPMACETAILVENVYDGAVVTLKRSSGMNESAGFDLERLRFLCRPFTEGESVSAFQSMSKCERDGNESGAITVNSVKALKPGVGRLCIGVSPVYIYNLQPGAIIHFDVNGTRYDLMPPADSTDYSFSFDLPAGTATVTQEICGHVSPPTVVTIEQCAAIASKPVIPKPIFDCARKVTVTNICPGAEVQLFVETHSGKGPISVRKVCLFEVADFDVNPHLKVNNFVYAVERGCGHSLMESDHVQVDQQPPINAPEIITPVESGATQVTVTGVIPTATICVYLLRNDAVTPIGFKRYAEGARTSISLTSTIKTDDKLAATQAYCAVTTEIINWITVVKPKPLAPVIKVPQSGSEDVTCEKLTISWVDPGAGKENAADQFEIEIYGDSQSPLATNQSVKTTSFSSVPNLKAGTYHTIKVRGINSTGAGPWGTCKFTTIAPKPKLTKFNQNILEGENFPKDPLQVEVTLDVWVSIPPDDTVKTKEGFPVILDNRAGTIKGLHYDGSNGKFSTSVDLISLLGNISVMTGTGMTAQTYFYKGPLKNEKVHFKVSYKPPNVKQVDSDDFIYIYPNDAPLQDS